jgi:bla regulator protein BlaR1
MTQDLVFLLNHLWQTSLVAVVAWLACRTMLKPNSPRVRFRVWLAVSLKFLIPFAVFVQAGRWLGIRPLLRPADSQQVFDIVNGGGSGLVTAPFRVSPASQSAIFRHDVLLMTLAIIWAMGAALVSVRWLRAWWPIRQAARTALPGGSFRGVPVLKSRHMREDRLGPGVFGFWRQAILIPDGMETRLTNEQFQAVLSHEWQHAQRRDNLTAAIQMVAEAVFWFYPVIWMVGRMLTQERELACDLAVLEEAPSDDYPEHYAEGILNVCKLYSNSRLNCMVGITGANLRARVESILKNERPRKLGRVKRWALAGALCLAAAGPAVIGFLTASAVFAQDGNSFVGLSTSAQKKFEVATVKLNRSGDDDFRLGPPRQGGITIVNVALRGLIVQSFRTQRNMVFGIPGWAESEKYDVVGKGPDPTAANPEVWEMMRSLLIERFHLKYHMQDREMDVFALTVAPRGPKLILGENGRCAEDIKAGRNCGDVQQQLPFGAAIHNMPIAALISGIGAVRAGRPVIDKTGLTGKYDVSLTWVPNGMKYENLDLENIPPEYRPQDVSLSEALEQQAGLKLIPQRAKVPALVIDSVTRPDPN